jgi:chromosome segregation protein
VLPNYKTLQFQVENLNEQLDEQQQQLTQQQQQREALRRRPRKPINKLSCWKKISRS